MGREVDVAEAEPGLGPQPPKRPEDPKAIVRDAPTCLHVCKTGERVGHRVYVGRDVKAVERLVVARVDHNRELLRGQRARQAQRQLGAADTSGDGEDVWPRHCAPSLAVPPSADFEERWAVQRGGALARVAELVDLHELVVGAEQLGGVLLG